MQQPDQHQIPRSLRETPLLLLAGVAIFVVAAILLAGVLFGQDDPGSSANAAADKPTATATASPTATGPAQPTTEPGSTGAVDQPLPATAAVTNPDAAAEPTAPTEPEPTSTSANADAAAPADLIDILPRLEDLPDGYVVTNEGSLALDELAELHPDPATQRDRLLDWGFTAAAERQFEPAQGTDAEPEALRLLATLVVEFRTPEGARAAVEAGHADAQAAENTDVSNVEIVPLGDLSLAASGTLTVDGETLRIAYVIIQTGDRAITFAGGSATGDPLAAVIQIASQTLNSR